jgi:hypothetical protein
MEIGRRVTSRASLSIVATELAAYNALWTRLLQSSPAGFDALRRTAHSLLVAAADQRSRRPCVSSGNFGRFSATFSRSMCDVGEVRDRLEQAVLLRGSSSLLDLAKGSYRVLLADLRLLYSQVWTPHASPARDAACSFVSCSILSPVLFSPPACLCDSLSHSHTRARTLAI